MKDKITALSGLLLGAIFFIFGLNGFLGFLPQPALPEGALPYMGGLASAPYFFPLLKGTEVFAGLLLLSGIAAPLALVVLAPISLQIFLFHAVLTPGLSNLVLPLLIIALHVTAAVRYWPAYRSMFTRQPVLARSGWTQPGVTVSIPESVSTVRLDRR